MGQVSREEYDRMSPYDAWLHRMRFGSPGMLPPHPGPNLKVDLNLPSVLQGAAPRPAVVEESPPVRMPLASSETKPPRRLGEGDPIGNLLSQPSRAGLLSQGSFNTSGANRLSAAEGVRQPPDPAKSPPGERGDEYLKRLMGLVNPDDITTPEESLYDTFTGQQRKLSDSNTAARNARIPVGRPSQETSDRRIKDSYRNKRTGQVDQLAFGGGLGGGRDALLVALAGQQPAEDLSSTEGRREAFGDFNFVPAAAGYTEGEDGWKRMDPGAVDRRLARREALKEYNAKRAGAGAMGVAAAAEGGKIEDVLAGLPPSAQRGARRAFMAEQQRQLDVAAQEKLIKAGQPKENLNDPMAERKKQMMVLMLDPNADPATREWAAREFRRMDGAMMGFNQTGGF